MHRTLAVALLLGGLSLAQHAAPAPADWEGQIIYQVMPDRYVNGDPGNDGGANPGDPQARHGGDLRGLDAHLQDVQDLGATTVWITPVSRQVPDVNGMAPYHGYWPQDFRSVDPHLGTLQDFRNLTAHAHRLGLNVMLDQVINHTGYGADAVNTHPDWFHTPADCQRAAGTQKDTDCPLSGLPDLNQTVPAVRDLLFGNADFWRTQGVDAYRYDAVKHVDQAFLKALVTRDRAAGTFTLGESFGADADTVRQGQELGLSSLFEFSLQAALRQGIMGGGSLNGVRSVLEQDARIPHPGLTANFLDNHDLPRFANGTLFEDQGQARTRYALRALMTLKGIPVLWQGTEIAQRGGADPDNRRDLPGRNAWTPAQQDVYATARDAVHVRRASAALSRGDQTLLPVPDASADDLLVFTRHADGETVLVAWNNARERRTYSLRTTLAARTLTASSFTDPGGKAQRAALSVSGGYLHLSLPPQDAAVFRLGE